MWIVASAAEYHEFHNKLAVLFYEKRLLYSHCTVILFFRFPSNERDKTKRSELPRHSIGTSELFTRKTIYPSTGPAARLRERRGNASYAFDVG